MVCMLSPGMREWDMIQINEHKLALHVSESIIYTGLEDSGRVSMPKGIARYS